TKRNKNWRRRSKSWKNTGRGIEHGGDFANDDERDVGRRAGFGADCGVFAGGRGGRLAGAQVHGGISENGKRFRARTGCGGERATSGELWDGERAALCAAIEAGG